MSGCRAGRALWHGVVLVVICSLGLTISALWYGMNSDRDDIHPLLTQLIPAGHCTCKTSTVFECSSCLAPTTTPQHYVPSSHWEPNYLRNEGLTEKQCNSAFPGLFEDVNRGMKYWFQTSNITTESLDQIQMVQGLTRAMIHGGHLYVIATKSRGEDHRRKIVATLSSIHRALSSYPEPANIPDIEFVFSVEDKAEDVASAGHPLWVLARKATEESLWLMPDFGFWAWDNVMRDMNNEIGPYDEVVDKASEVDDGLSFVDKERKLVWRGKLSFAPKLRRTLLDRSRNHEWSDVKELIWQVKENYLTLEDHCKYQFIAHAEGRSYSASLKYRQACHSVIVIHKLQYIQHHHYLLVSSGPQQNYVGVERDFSDLADKMRYLLDNPEEAQRIADNNVQTFRDKYLTPAAEACYWRALWRGYAAASEPVDLWQLQVDGSKRKRALRYETFLLLSSEEMLEFSAD